MVASKSSEPGNRPGMGHNGGPPLDDADGTGAKPPGKTPPDPKAPRPLVPPPVQGYDVDYDKVSKSAPLSLDVTDLPFKVPSGWTMKPTNKGGEFRFSNPANSNDFVRIMPGSPTSNFPAKRSPYVVRAKHGQIVDALGRLVGASSAEAHIPLSEFKWK